MKRGLVGKSTETSSPTAPRGEGGYGALFDSPTSAGKSPPSPMGCSGGGYSDNAIPGEPTPRRRGLGGKFTGPPAARGDGGYCAFGDCATTDRQGGKPRPSPNGCSGGGWVGWVGLRTPPGEPTPSRGGLGGKSTVPGEPRGDGGYPYPATSTLGEVGDAGDAGNATAVERGLAGKFTEMDPPAAPRGMGGYCALDDSPATFVGAGGKTLPSPMGCSGGGYLC